jgi:hypothetical protein
MEKAYEVLKARYGEVFLYQTKNLKVISEESDTRNGENFTVYASLLDTGSANPVVLVALSKDQARQNPVRFQDLNASSVHVRSYKSWDDFNKSGLNLEVNNPQKPTLGALHNFKDFPMQMVSGTDDSKTYQFPDGEGRMTVFTSKPVINTGGNDLPNKTTFLPWVNSYNFVYERK